MISQGSVVVTTGTHGQCLMKLRKLNVMINSTGMSENQTNSP